MKIPTPTRTSSVGFNVTPLIDIVFLLVIFFLVASHVARTEAVEPVVLPEATSIDDQHNQSPHRVVITLLPDLTLSVAGQPVEQAQIEREPRQLGRQILDVVLDKAQRLDMQLLESNGGERFGKRKIHKQENIYFNLKEKSFPILSYK